MRNFKIATYMFGLFLVFSACNQDLQNKLPSPFEIIPKPQKVEIYKGESLKYQKLTSLEMTGLTERPVMGEILSRLVEAKSNEVRLSLVLDSTLLETGNPEGYVLNIQDGHVEIRSAGEAGIFYGCQTLEQLLEDARDFDIDIPACKITDYPALSYRAVHFDVKHHLDHMHYYYTSIDRLARYKINAVIFEFEDKLQYVRQPLVGASQGISIDEMAALTKYAAARNIEISPLVQGLGHATFILKHEHYADLREIPGKSWVFCPADEGTYNVLFDMYSDAMDATPGSKYLHIGGDEIGDIGTCPRCKPIAEKEGMMSLNLYWLNRVCNFIVANGRTPIFWDDMPLKQAGVYESTWNDQVNAEQAAKVWESGEANLENLVQKFPKKCVYMRWNYELGRLPGNMNALNWYKENGLPVMVSTAAQTGGLLFPKDERTGSMTNGGIVAIQSFLQLAEELEVDGMLCTAWDDDSPHFETYWRGLIASAEYSWAPEGRSLEDFDRAFLQREFGTSVTDYSTLYKMLTETTAFWSTAFMRNGSRNDISNALTNLQGLAHWIPEEEKEKQQKKTDFTDVVIELPDANNPGEWTKLYEERLKNAEEVIGNYAVTSEGIDDLYARSKRNRYHWEIFNVLNDFQITAPKLLLAIKQCDTDNEDLRNKGIEDVKAALGEFNESWEDLKATYSKTRFITYPDNYLADRYFHYASHREDLTWMIQVEELFHSMIIDWIKERESV